MKHNLLQCLMLIAALLTSAHAFAHDFEAQNSDGVTIYYNIVSSTNKTCAVTYKGTSYSEYIEYTGDVVIPESVTFEDATYSVTSIGSYAFYNCDGLTSVTIPNSVTSIGDSAFNYCDGLTSITIPNSVTRIREYAFNNCTGLTTIKVETENSKYDSRNNCNAIIETESNTLIVGCMNTNIPNSVTSIGDDAFGVCTGLTSVTIPNSVTSIGGGAFEGCTGLTSVIFNAENCKTMGSYDDPVFKNCTKLSSVAIGENVKNIPSCAFRGCSGLTTIKVETGNSKYDSRNNCNAIIETESNTLIIGCKNSIIPNSITSINQSAFKDCSGLTSIEIPNSVTSIECYAFDGCSGLKELRIEDGESTLSLGYNSYSSFGIGEGLFGDCPLQTLYLGRKLLYSTGEEYGYSPFYNNSSLKTVTIGNNVTGIGDYTFYSCTGLTKVIIGSSVENIEKYAFANIERLAKIYLLNPTPSTCASEDIFNKVNKDKCTLYVPLGAAEDYKTTYVWWDFNNIIEKEMSGVEETLINRCEDEHAVYYNLQGVKVENPERGLYIKRQGGKTTKVIL